MQTSLTLRRRHLLQAAAGSLLAPQAWAATSAPASINLNFASPPTQRPLTTAFPQKTQMILQRSRPALLETPFSVFDQGVFTPNNQFFVRWHWAVIPEQVDVTSFRLTVRGHVNSPLSLTLQDLLKMPRVKLAAVNQCSGNSRGLFDPRVPGGQWANGAMGNAEWVGVRLRDVLDRAGIKAGAICARFDGLDEPVVDGAPDFRKSLAIDHARDGEVMIAYQMNGEQLPLLNGFPLRLIVPGWYSTYWVKMLSDIEVLDVPDDNFWMKTAYKIPDTAGANVKPGEKGFKTVPINRMVPRSFFTNITEATSVKPHAPLKLRGIAFGGDCGVKQVDLSADQGATWHPATLGKDEGAYSFRQWSSHLQSPAAGKLSLMVRATNTKGLAQPATPNWNPGGFMRNVIEHLQLSVA